MRCLAVGLLAFVFATAAASLGFRLNLTGSMPPGIYRVTQRPVDREAIVLVCLPRPVASIARARGYIPRGSCDSGVAPVGKYVFAVSGDTVTVTTSGLELNGALSPKTEPARVDSRGRPLPRLPKGPHVVHGDELWLYSPFSVRSFDSRYFGPVPRSAVIGVVQPVLTKN